ncbi:atrial natriuretic peptide receptor 1-like [Paramacrobiotus metropolitanus]|uniref:atrial natriuretic peptide receptor 1-like n=1 Tax=Paramacrobiotus metropolitanus TaxID=2943436 RepID=UPI00244641B3|nr:atrial natriuretic peptide receptor 1-like [Paramacrobiotus metropolitanus]
MVINRLSCAIPLFFLFNFVTLFDDGVSALNVTVVVYGMWMPPLLQSLIYTAAGFDLGWRDTVKMLGESNVSLTIDYTASKDIMQCPDISANYYRVAEQYYHAQEDPSRALGIFYPGCDADTTLADFGREWNVFTLSSGTTFSNLRNRSIYPTTIAMGPMQYELYGLVAGRFLQAHNWTSAALIFDISGLTVYNLRVAEAIIQYFRRYYEYMEMHAFPVNISAVTDFPRIIRELSTFTRVIFLSMPPESASLFLVRVYIDIPGSSTSPLGRSYINDTKSVFLQPPVLFLTICYDHEERDVAELKKEMQDLARRKYNATFRPGTGPSELVMTAYTSILLYGKAIQETLLGGQDPRNGTAVAQVMQNRTFAFPSVGRVYIDEQGERQNILCFFSFQNDSRTFEKVWYFDGARKKLRKTNFSINWGTPTNAAPPNKPVCGYHKELPPCRRGWSTAAAVGLAIGIIIAVLGISVCVFRHVQKTPTDDEWWILKTDCINNAKIAASTKCPVSETGNLLLYKGAPVWSRTVLVLSKAKLPHVSTGDIHITTAFRKTMAEVRLLMERCRNINPLIGLDLDMYRITYMYAFCPRGSLIDVAQEMHLEWALKSSLISDLVEAVTAIHRSPLRSHGYLRPSKCLIDRYFVLKIGDTGLYRSLVDLKLDTLDDDKKDIVTFVAPELRGKNHETLTQRHPSVDVFSVGELISYILHDHDKEELSTFADDDHDYLDTSIKTRIVLDNIVQQCQSDNSSLRPSIYEIRKELSKVISQSGRLVDQMVARLEDYATHLENAVTLRTQTLKMEIDRCDALLGEMLPRYIIVQLRIGHTVHAQEFPSVTLLFASVSGFDDFVIHCQDKPLEIVDLLGFTFSTFDRIMAKYDCYKVETITDNCLVVSGLPMPNGDEHVHIIGKLALGSCAAGIVGTARPRYCV